MRYQRNYKLNQILVLFIFIFNYSIKVYANTETTIIFNVVNVESKEICVNINENSFKLTNKEYPLWTISQKFNNYSKDIPVLYNYSYCDSTKHEAFNRTINIIAGEENKTGNDVFDRPPTNDVTNLSEIWEEAYYPSSNEIFDINYVGTFYLNSKDKNLLNIMNEIPHNNIKVPVKGKFIGKTFTKSINEDGWEISIAGKNSRMYTKQSFRLAYRGDNDEDELNISIKRLKFKAFPSDITMLREPLSIEILQRIGVPTYRGFFSRLYIDNDYYGLYYVEDDMRKPYIKNLFHRSAKKKAEIGSLFQAVPDKENYIASLNYYGDDLKNYPNWNSTWECKINGTEYGTEEDGFRKIISLMKSINQTKFDEIKDKNNLYEEIYNVFELDILIRVLATDYLFGRFHGYWRNPSNYMIYFHPALSRFVIFPVDYTSSFGYKYNENDYNFSTNYTEWRSIDNIEDPLINLIFKIPILQKLLLSTMKLLTNTIFTSKALSPFIDSITEIIKYDLTIDKTICPSHSKNSVVTDEPVTLISIPCSISNSLYAINSSLSNVGYGIKEWIEERSKFVNLLLINETQHSAGSLVTRPADPSNLYSDSILDYFLTIFPSGRYGLLAFLLIIVFIAIVIFFIIYQKCKKPTEMVGDEHDIRKYNGSFMHRLKNNNYSLNETFNSIKSFFKKIYTSVKNSLTKNSHNID